jgi:hypothetical protein
MVMQRQTKTLQCLANATNTPRPQCTANLRITKTATLRAVPVAFTVAVIISIIIGKFSCLEERFNCVTRLRCSKNQNRTQSSVFGLWIASEHSHGHFTATKIGFVLLN